MGSAASQCSSTGSDTPTGTKSDTGCALPPARAASSHPRVSLGKEPFVRRLARAPTSSTVTEAVLAPLPSRLI
jgi:hypothetical protein